MNRTTFQPGPLAQVDCVAADDRWTLVFVRELRHSPEKVWKALTEPKQLARWVAPTSAANTTAIAGMSTLLRMTRGAIT